MKILVMQFSYCQCSALKWTVWTETEILWFYSMFMYHFQIDGSKFHSGSHYWNL